MADDGRWRRRFDSKKLLRRARRAEKVTRRHARRFIASRLDNVKSVARLVVVWLVTVAVLIATVGVQLVWSENNYSTDAYADGGVYVEGVVGSFDSLDPLFAVSSAEQSAAKLMFSSLYDYDNTGALRNDVATAMTTDSTAHSYVVNLRHDVLWHDGEPLTAYDVAFTVGLIKDPLIRSPLRVSWSNIGVEALDNYTVKFTLPAVYAAFPQALTFPILPQHILKNVPVANIRESSFSDSPIGSGPFVFHRLRTTTVSAGQQALHLDANAKYYRGTPKLSQIELHAYSDEDALVKALNNGELTAASDIGIVAARSVTKSNYHQVPLALDSGVYLILNTRGGVLQDAKVRQALQLATNVSEIRKTLGGGVLPLNGPVLNSQLAGSEIPRPPSYNLDAARKVLTDDGWILKDSVYQKDGQKLELSIVTTKDKEYDEVLKMVMQQWQQLGVTLVPQVVDVSSASSTFVQNVLQARNFDVLLYKLSIGADPDVYAYWHSSQAGSGYNLSGYTNDIADANLASARTRIDPELRQAKYVQFVKQWLKDVPAIGLYQPAIEYVSGSDIATVKVGDTLVTGADRYANVLDWSSTKHSVYKTP